MKKALFYEEINGKIRCLLCGHKCIIKEEEKGICRGRINKKGILYSINYQKCSSLALDPIEKKPLYHFYPGKMILSIGTVGCSFKCPFCQNWRISQMEAPAEDLESSYIVKMALNKNSIGIAYTYSEPLIWYEYVLETARLAKENGLVNVLVTNGYINKEPLLNLLPYIDALNIDLKSFKESFYKKYCKSELNLVLESIEISKKNALVELTNLIIPTLNDTQEEIEAMVEWISSKLGRDTPLHFSRYYPQYKMNIPPTPFETLKKAYLIAQEKLDYVYIGNVLDTQTNTTYCPKCKKEVIVRSGYDILEKNIKDKKCLFCGEVLYVLE